uniref:Uncharacterized protein n=1 Tax=Salix viminalis TaxID=40686 RepID=A0A6N2LT48_SALVM
MTSPLSSSLHPFTAKPDLSLLLSSSRPPHFPFEKRKINHQLRAPPRRDPPLCTRNPAATSPWNNEEVKKASNHARMQSLSANCPFVGSPEIDQMLQTTVYNLPPNHDSANVKDEGTFIFQET